PLSQGGPDPGAALRLHRRLRRRPRGLPGERAAGGADHLRAHVSVRLARPSGRDPAGLARADLLPSRARPRPVQHALADAQPPLYPVRPRREPRRMAGRADLGRAASASGRRCRCRPAARPRAGEGHHPDAQLRRAADALRPAVPRRGRRAYRAADRGEGPESRRRRRARARARPDRILRLGPHRPARRLLRHLSAAHLESAALLLVDDLDAAPFPRTQPVRGPAPARGAGLRHELARRLDRARRELRRPAVRLTSLPRSRNRLGRCPCCTACRRGCTARWLSTRVTPGTRSAARRSASASPCEGTIPQRCTAPSLTTTLTYGCQVRPARSNSTVSRSRSARSSTLASAAGCSANARKRSARLTIPTSSPSRTTGTRLIRRASSSRAISGSGVSGVTVTTERVITSQASRP